VPCGPGGGNLQEKIIWRVYIHNTQLVSLLLVAVIEIMDLPVSQRKVLA